jgi:hypothetical protein
MTSRIIQASQRVYPRKMESHRTSLTVALSSHLFMVQAITVVLDKALIIIPLKGQEVTLVRAMLASAQTKKLGAHCKST